MNCLHLLDELRKRRHKKDKWDASIILVSPNK